MVATTLDGVILHDVFASRPAVGTVAKGAVFSATDTKVIYQSDGAAWNTMFDGSGFTTNPLTTTGDIIYSSSGTTAARLALGSTGKFLTAGATIPAWGQGPLTTTGDLMLGATGGTPTRLAVGGATTVLHGGASTPAYSAVVEGDLSTSDITTANVVSTKHGFAPKTPADATQFLNGAATAAFAAVKDADLSTSDITTNNASTSKHGFLKKLSNAATDYMDGTGAWSVPAGGGSLTIKDEGSSLATATTSLDFVGSGVVASGAGAAKTITIAGGGTTIQRPAITPGSFDATYGDDFSAASLNARWTTFRGWSSGDIITQGIDGSWFVGPATSGGTNLCQVYQTYTNSDMDISACLSVRQLSAVGGMFGIMAVDSSGDGVAACIYNDGNAYVMTLTAYAYSGTGQTIGSGWADAFNAGMQIYLRLVRSTNNWTGYASKAGASWEQTNGTPHALTKTINRIGFGQFYSSGNPFAGQIVCDWFQKA